MTNKDSNLQEQAYSKIREKIIYCTFPPGTKLSEKDLEDKIKIGRTPIREALIRLRREELLYTKAQSGNYISKINLSTADNARFVREHIEKLVMIECCSKVTDNDFYNLEKILDVQKKAAIENDPISFFISDDEFHKYFYSLVGKEEIWDWMQTHNTHLNRFRLLRLKVVELRWQTILEQHYQIFEALKSKNPEESEFLTAQHLHMMIDEKHKLIEAYPDYFQE